MGRMVRDAGSIENDIKHFKEPSKGSLAFWEWCSFLVTSLASLYRIFPGFPSPGST